MDYTYPVKKFKPEVVLDRARTLLTGKMKDVFIAFFASDKSPAVITRITTAHGLSLKGIDKMLNVAGFKIKYALENEELLEALKKKDYASALIKSMGLTAYTTNSLIDGHVTTLQQLLTTPLEELFKMKSFGPKALSELIAKLNELEVTHTLKMPKVRRNRTIFNLSELSDRESYEMVRTVAAVILGYPPTPSQVKLWHATLKTKISEPVI